MPHVDMARAVAVRRGVRLEVITVVWMVAEAVIAVGAGVAAKSVLLTAFGFDSVVELLSGIVLLQLLTTEARGAAVVLTSIAGLVLGIRPGPSALGLAVTAVALVAMPLLARAKRGVNRVINSASLRADIAETISCAYLAAITLAGLGLSMLLGWWWAEYVAALGLLIWLLPETREAVEAALQRTVAGEPGP
jgi:divalent metal cation (Fe/Co/Zn/Cd) transporter